MKPKVNGLEVVGQLKPSLILGIVLLVAVVGAVATFVVARGRSEAGAVGRGQTLGQAACLGFTLVSLQVHLLATMVAPAVAVLARGQLPAGGRVLAVLGQTGSLPTWQGSVAFAGMLLGLGLWQAVRSEAARREDGLATVRRITFWMTLGTVVLLVASGYAIVSLWGLVPEPQASHGGRG